MVMIQACGDYLFVGGNVCNMYALAHKRVTRWSEVMARILTSGMGVSIDRNPLGPLRRLRPLRLRCILCHYHGI